MSVIQASAFSLRSRLEEFEQFQEFCLNYQHGIKRVRSDTPLYTQSGVGDYQSRRATTFIYAFFAFNDIYKINWETSLKEPDNEPTEWLGPSQQKMFWDLSRFCFQNRPTSINPYASLLVEYCKRLDVNNPLSELKRIDLANNQYLVDKIVNQYKDRQGNGNEISMQSISDFQDSFDLLYENGKQGAAQELSDGLTHINNVLYFVYLVRCSVFHGKKQLTVAQLGRDQDVRLAIYAAAIMAMNQVVIERARQHI